MSDTSIAHIEAAIRHRDLSYRAIVAMVSAVGALAVGAALLDLSRDGVPTSGLAADRMQGWSDMATIVLGHFSFSFLIAVVMAAVYELMVMRHLRSIASQVRGGDWLAKGMPIRLKRDWIGASDDLDHLVGALNEARDHGYRTRAALTWRVAQCQAATSEADQAIRALKSENTVLRANLREQAAFARTIAGDVQHCLATSVSTEFPAIPNVTSMPSSLARVPGVEMSAPLGRLISEFADFTTALSGQLTDDEVCLEDLLRSIVDELRLATITPSVRVEIGRLPVVRGDKGLFRRLFSELLARPLAARDTPHSLTIRVKSTPIDAGLVRVSVIDNARACNGTDAPAGPDKDDRQARETLEQRRLSMCRQIVAAHGGDLACDLGEETRHRIEVTLPLANREDEPEKA